MRGGKIKYPLLHDKEWMYQKYVTEQLGAPEIARLLGSRSKGFSNIYKTLESHGIQVRDKRQCQLCQHEDDQFNMNLSIIEGGLLGDALLRCQGKQTGRWATSQPYFRRKNKHKDHVEWVAEQLCGSYGLSHVKDVSAPMFTGAWCQCYEFATRSHEELMPIYDRWYPASNNYKKLVPRDFKLDEVSLLHWFLDDGSTSYQTRQGAKTNNIVHCFCSECFTLSDQEFLAKQMQDIWGLNASVRFYKKSKTSTINDGELYRIHIPNKQKELFFNIIGDPPVKSLSYKWKI